MIYFSDKSRKLKFFKCDALAKIPLRATKGSAGIDLYSVEAGILPPLTRRAIRIGLKVILPFNTYGRIAPRSGLAMNGIDVAAGVIDSDYRGEIKVILCNNSKSDFVFGIGNKIAQMIVEKIEVLKPTLTSGDMDKDLKNERNEKGFGSTGK